MSQPPSPDIVLPDVESSVVVISPPGEGRGNWAGAPSAVKVDDTYYLAYRMRSAEGDRGYGLVIASSPDGIEFETQAVFNKAEFGAQSLERPALITRPDGGFRVYVSCASIGSDHWWVDAMDAGSPAEFDASTRVTVLPGNELTALKDPVVMREGTRWHIWVCLHPLSDPAATDRMTTLYGTSDDGLNWRLEGTALASTEGTWFERGARVACIRRTGQKWLAYFDGRASASENAEELTGVAFGDEPGNFQPADKTPAAVSPWGSGSLRYLSIVDLDDGASRLYFEACLPDGSHALFTQLCEPTRTGSR